MKYSDPKFPKKTFFVGVTFFSFGLFGFVGMLLKKILSGQGDHHYFAGFGYQFSYVGALWALGLVLLMVLAVIYFHLRADKEERDFVRHVKNKKTKS